MKFANSELSLYLVTDSFWTGEYTLMEQVQESLENGVTFLQLREKELQPEDFLKRAIEMKDLAEKYKVPFVINDNVDVAVECGCHGVHIGQDDMEISHARSLIGDEKILGVSVGTVEEALKAQNEGADYLGVGAMFSTSTKNDAKDISLEVLSKICSAVDIPVVAIGGINRNNLRELKGTGIYGVAVVSAILAQKDIAQSTKELREICKECFEEEMVIK